MCGFVHSLQRDAWSDQRRERGRIRGEKGIRSTLVYITSAPSKDQEVIP
nr:hypothetical protein GCM10010200_024390 [Actinomadura rugatobispora]